MAKPKAVYHSARASSSGPAEARLPAMEMCSRARPCLRAWPSRAGPAMAGRPESALSASRAPSARRPLSTSPRWTRRMINETVQTAEWMRPAGSWLLSQAYHACAHPRWAGEPQPLQLEGCRGSCRGARQASGPPDGGVGEAAACGDVLRRLRRSGARRWRRPQRRHSAAISAALFEKSERRSGTPGLPFNYARHLAL